MKRFTACLLTMGLILSLCACASPNTVTFYFVRDPGEYQYGAADSVMVGESREAAGHVDDLHYLLTLYFHGPVTDSLRSPFPSGTKLVELTQEADSMTIQLSSIFTMLEGTDLTLACACLARTCFNLTDVGTVTILAAGRETVTMTMERDSLLLADDTTAPTNEESE